MRIGFDARMIEHPGIGRYIKALLRELIKNSHEHTFVIFGDPSKLAVFLGSKNVVIRSWTAPIYSILEQLTALSVLRDIDVLHVPHFNIPLFYTGKLVVTIHDLIYLLVPGTAPSPLAKIYAKYMIKESLKRSERVITVSSSTKNDLIKYFNGNYSDKIDVIYEAADEKFREIGDGTRIADVKCRYRLEKRIILYVGSVKPHKNIPVLIKTFILLKSWGIPHQLVICGKWDKKLEHIKDNLSDKNICYLGEVSEEDLVALYNMADVLVHVSLYEGFGLTALEAMQCGTPVILSDTSSLPEIAGKAAFLVPPDNVEQMADIIYNVLLNPKIKEGMIETGLEHVKQFSWDNTAKKTLMVYSKISA